MENIKIIYIGKDELFIKSSLEIIEKYKLEDHIILKSMFLEEEGELVAKFVPEVIGEKPQIIIIDFSYKFECIRKLARRLRLCLNSEDVSCVGVLNSPEKKNETISEEDLFNSREKSEWLV